ncbi:hypothetical protein PMAYCL1PPCAC_32518, partial [Pristionchus mayeri]
NSMSNPTRETSLAGLENLVKSFERLLTGDRNAKLRKSTGRPVFVARIFYDAVRLLKENDALLRIDPSSTNQKAWLVISAFLSTFFNEFVARLSPTFLSSMDSHMADAGIAKHSRSIHLRNQVLPQLIIDREAQRKTSRRFLDVQRLARQQEKGVELDIDEEDVKHIQAMTKEEAVLMIQSFERVYQSISRRDYLRHVMQKAMDLRSEKKKMDPIQAVIKIQARTRGYFTRKKVREMREREHEILGISVKGTLMKTQPVPDRICPRLYSTEKEATRGFQSLASSIHALLEEVKSKYFVMSEEPRVDCSQAATTFDELLENAYADLYLRRIIANPARLMSMDLMVTQKATCTISGATFTFDLKNLIYLLAVIPMQLRAWSHHHARPWILLIGDELSGKSGWVDAISLKTNSVLIRLNKKALAKQRSHTIGNVLKFIRRNDHSLISIDRLECFRSGPEAGHIYRSTVLNLLKALSKTPSFVIGMSRVEEISPAVTDYFPIKIRIDSLDNFSRIDVLTHSLHRLGDPARIPKLPQRLTEMRKAAAKYNTGGTVQFVQRRFTRLARNYVMQ